MVKRCVYPKCYTKKDGRKCLAPNSWIIFLRNNGGQGLSRSQISQHFQTWKQSMFPENSSVTQRRQILCSGIDSERIETEAAEALNIENERVEAERVEALNIEAERMEEQRIADMEAADSLNAEHLQIEAKRTKAEHVRAARIESERVEEHRIAAESRAIRIDAERLEKEHAEAVAAEETAKEAYLQILNSIAIIRKNVKGVAKKRIEVKLALKNLKIARSSALRARKIRIKFVKRVISAAKIVSKKRVISAAKRPPSLPKNKDEADSRYGPDVYSTEDYGLLESEIKYIRSIKANLSENNREKISKSEENEKKRKYNIRHGKFERKNLPPLLMDRVNAPGIIHTGYQYKTQGLKDFDYESKDEPVRKGNAKRGEIMQHDYPEGYTPNGEIDTHKKVLDRYRIDQNKVFDSVTLKGKPTEKTQELEELEKIAEVAKGYVNLATENSNIVDFTSNKTNEDLQVREEVNNFLEHLNAFPEEPNEDFDQLKLKIERGILGKRNKLSGVCSLQEEKFNFKKFLEQVIKSYNRVKPSGTWRNDGELNPNGNQDGNYCEIVERLFHLPTRLNIKALLGGGITGSVFIARNNLRTDVFVDEAIKVTPLLDRETERKYELSRLKFWYGVHMHREIYKEMNNALNRKIVFDEDPEHFIDTDGRKQFLAKPAYQYHKSVIIPVPLHAKTLYRTRSDKEEYHHYLGVFRMKYDDSTEVRELLKSRGWEQVLKKYARTLKLLHLSRFSHGDAHTSNFMEGIRNGGKTITIDMDRAVNLKRLKNKELEIEAVRYDLKFALYSLKDVFDGIYKSKKSDEDFGVKIGVWDSWMTLFSEAYVGRKDITKISYRNTEIIPVDKLSYSEVSRLDEKTIKRMFDYYSKHIYHPQMNKLRDSMGVFFFTW